MLEAVEGIYHGGKVDLLERPEALDGARVIVTFLPEETQGRRPPLTRAEAAEMRAKLAAWEEDWNAPGMEVYDAL